MENLNSNNVQNQQQQVVSAAQFNSKFKSKMEVYRFLSFEVGAYLPPYDTVTIYHLKDIASGNRTLIKSNAIKTVKIPHFDGLTIERMLHHANQVKQVK